MSTKFFASPYTPVPRVVLDEELHQLERRAACIHLCSRRLPIVRA